MELTNDCQRIRVDKEFICIESHSIIGIPGAVNSKAVSPPRANVRDEGGMHTLIIVFESEFCFSESLGFITRKYAEFHCVSVGSPEADPCTAIFENRDSESVMVAKLGVHRSNLP